MKIKSLSFLKIVGFLLVFRGVLWGETMPDETFHTIQKALETNNYAVALKL